MSKPRTNLAKLTHTQQRVLRNFENAVHDLAYIGSAPVDERPIIKQKYDQTKNLLITHLANKQL